MKKIVITNGVSYNSPEYRGMSIEEFFLILEEEKEKEIGSPLETGACFSGYTLKTNGNEIAKTRELLNELLLVLKGENISSWKYIHEDMSNKLLIVGEPTISNPPYVRIHEDYNVLKVKLLSKDNFSWKRGADKDYCGFSHVANSQSIVINELVSKHGRVWGEF